MMKLIIGSTLTALLAQAHFAHAGGMDSAGGVGVRCFDANGSSSTLELLDLHEARIRGLKLPIRNGSAKEIAEEISKSIDRIVFEAPNFDVHVPEINRISKHFDGILKKYHFIEKGQPLELTHDLGKVEIQRGCELTQVAVFKSLKDSDSVTTFGPNGGSEGSLDIDPDKFAELSPTHQAALLVHEALYETARARYHATTSATVRFLVGGFFSNTQSQNIYTGLRRKNIECKSDWGLAPSATGSSQPVATVEEGKLDFYVIPESGNETRIQFTSMPDKAMYSLETGKIATHWDPVNDRGIHGEYPFKTEVRLGYPEDLLLQLNPETTPTLTFLQTGKTYPIRCGTSYFEAGAGGVRRFKKIVDSSSLDFQPNVSMPLEGKLRLSVQLQGVSPFIETQIGLVTTEGSSKTVSYDRLRGCVYETQESSSPGIVQSFKAKLAVTSELAQAIGLPLDFDYTIYYSAEIDSTEKLLRLSTSIRDELGNPVRNYPQTISHLKTRIDYIFPALKQFEVFRCGDVSRFNYVEESIEKKPRSGTSQ